MATAWYRPFPNEGVWGRQGTFGDLGTFRDLLKSTRTQSWRALRNYSSHHVSEAGSTAHRRLQREGESRGWYPDSGRQNQSDRSYIAQVGDNWNGSEMQAARLTPSVGRQLLRLGNGRFVYFRRDWAAVPGLRPGLNSHFPQLAALYSLETAGTVPRPTTVCQWCHSGK